MLLVLLGVSQLLLTCLLLFTPLWFWVLFGWFLYLTLYFYLDDGPMHGRRSWTHFKRLSLWKSVSPIRFVYTNREAIETLQSPCLFVVMPNLSNMALVYGFGWNGGTVPMPVLRNGQPRSCVYLLPRLLFYIPFLRDWLLWSGAVANRGYDSILDHINAGQCVAYNPCGMEELFLMERGKLIIKAAGHDIFQFARDNNIHIVPVLVYGEQERYYMYRNTPWQRWSYRMCEWPFPFWVFPRIFGQGPPPPLRLFVGNPMNPSLHEKDEAFYNLFYGAIKGMNNVGSDQALEIKE